MQHHRFCSHFSEANEVWIFNHKIGAVMLALGMLYFFMSLVIIYFIKIQEYYARTGNDEAVQSVIFPIFVRVLWANAFVNIYVGILALTFTLEPFSSNQVAETWAFSTMYALQHLVTEGVALLLMQKGLGIYAAQTSFKQASLWAVITLGFMVLTFHKENPDRSFIASVIWQSLLVIFYGGLWLLPQKRLFRRPAVIYYARSWCLFRLLCISATLLYYFKETSPAGSCVYVLGNLFPFAVFEPLLLYYTLLQDSKWWQGQDIFQGRRDKDAEEIRSPLQGIDINLKSAQSLAASMDRMGKLTPTAAATLHANPTATTVHMTTPSQLESGREGSHNNHSSIVEHKQSVVGGGAVKLLNFAYISLDKNKQLGSGSFSRVYLGKYRQQSCAVKLIFTVDLTVDVIKRIAAEAQLLSLIRHANVVDILGVSVLPPSVCILLELCIHGSLGDTLRNTGAITSALCAFTPILEANHELVDISGSLPPQSMRGFLNGFNSFVSYDRAIHPTAQNELSYRTTSNVSTLMSVSTANTMGGSSSSSFNMTHALGGGGGGGGTSSHHNTHLPGITNQQVQALSLCWKDRLFIAVGCARGLAALHGFSSDLCHRDIKSFNFLIDGQLNAKISDLELGMAELLNHSSSRKKATGTPSMGDSSDRESDGRTPLAGTEILANWAAPEVIQGSSYTQAADVYSFALVLWEILVGRVPFSEVKRQDEIRRRVVAGTRPIIPSCFLTGPSSAMFNSYIDLIQRAWDPIPQQRPTIMNILAELEDMWHCSSLHLLATTDATLSVDDVYLKNLSAQAVRMASITNDDPTATIVSLCASPGGVGEGSTSPVYDGTSASMSASWWGGSFIASKNPSMHGSGMGQFSSPGEAGPSESVAQRVLENLRAEDDGMALHALESSGACYVLVLPLPPHEVVWATHSWCLMSGCDVSDIVGQPLHSLPIFDSSSFVKIKSGSQRKGSLAAELEAPRSRAGDLLNAFTSAFFSSTGNTAAAVENANATSLFFKSLQSRYLHRIKSCHAIINVLDFSSRTWNMSASDRNVNTFSRRLVHAVTGRGQHRRPALSTDSGGLAAGTAGPSGLAQIDTLAQVVCSSFSVHAYPIYQRTIAAKPIHIPAAPATPNKVPKNKSGLFNIGSFGKLSFSGSPTPEMQQYAMDTENTSRMSAGTGARSSSPTPSVQQQASYSPVPPGVAQNSDSRASSEEADSTGTGERPQIPASAQHIALVGILFSRMREPPQLMLPLPTPSTASATATGGPSHHLSTSSSRNRSSFRIMSAGSQSTGGLLQRNLTGNNEDDSSNRSSCIEMNGASTPIEDSHV